MKTFDRILIGLATVSLFAIGMIFFTDEISSTYLKNYTKKDQKRYFENKSNIIDYERDIDKVFHKYMQSVKQDPARDEEESRILEDSDLEDENSKSKISSNETISKKDLNELLQNSDSSQSIDHEDDSLSANLDSNKTTASAGKKLEHQQVSEGNDQTQDKRFQVFSHKVKAGESLWRIAQKYGVSVYTIVSANPHKARNIISPGEILKVPSKNGVFHKVSKGQSLSNIAYKYKVDIHKVKEVNRINTAHLSIGQRVFIPGGKPLPRFKMVDKNLFIWPLRGRLTSKFGWRKHPIQKHRQFHPGIDLGARYGTSIRAAASGVVVYSGWAGAYGKLVMLRHKNGYFTAYAHCSKLKVKKGKLVKQGQTIAKVGSTGTSTGSHLHFEVKRYGKKINPYRAFKETIKIKVEV